MKMNKLFTSLRRVVKTPKLYSILFKREGEDGRVLWHTAAFSLEEAIEKSKDEMEDKRVDVGGLRMELFLDSKVADLLQNYINPNMQKDVDPITFLMMQIVEGKDKNMFEENKDMFTDSQRKYLEDKLAIKKK